MFHLFELYYVDIDECVKGEHNCSKYARCKSSYGGYSCECLKGFEGDGETCTCTLAHGFQHPNVIIQNGIYIVVRTKHLKKFTGVTRASYQK